MHSTYHILREKHIKATPQRLSVYESFNGQGHLSAEDVYQRARKKIPRISLGTVYSILEHLKESGLLSEIKIDFEKSLYERKGSDHHHFLCRRCGTIFDIKIPNCATLQDCAVNGHTIEDFQGYFYGTCRDCQQG